MADDVKPKRRLRTPPQTIRERNESLRNQTPKQQNAFVRGLGSFWYGFTLPARALGHQIAKLGRFKVFRVIAAILLPRYIRNSWRELRLVSWPNAKQSINLTWAVLVFSIIFGVIVAILDFGLDKLFKEFIVR
jgi:preprotein translocase SecE subunit